MVKLPLAWLLGIFVFSAYAEAQPYIFRPYVLPTGTQELDFTATGIAAQSQETYNWRGFYDFNFNYRRALTSELTVLWSPLPLGLQYQPEYSREDATGASWYVGLSHQQKIGLRPTFTSYYRHVFSNDRSIEFHLRYFTFIPFSKSAALWGGAFGASPVFQFTSSLAFIPRIDVAFENYKLRTLSEDLYGNDREQIQSTSVARFTLPISMAVNYMLNPNVDLTFQYCFIGVGLNQDEHAHDFTLRLKNRW